jgi:hypothetical protein
MNGERKNTKVRNLSFISMFMKMSGVSNFLCFYVLCAGTYVEGEEDMSFWSPKLFGRYANYVWEESGIGSLCLYSQSRRHDIQHTNWKTGGGPK